MTNVIKNKIVSPVLAATAAVAMFAGAAQAQAPLKVSGQIDFGFRFYPEDGTYAGQSSAGNAFFMGGEFNASMGVGPGNFTLQFTALSDDRDGRSNVNLTKAHYTQVFETWDLLVGYNVENWGVAESRSVLNVMNPVNNTDLSFGQDLVGTPMINANFNTSVGTFSAYALVGFEQPYSAQRSSRGRGPFATYNGRATYEEGEGRNLDVALRFTNNYTVGDGSLDFAASYFNGTSRQPVGLPGCGYTFGGVGAATCDSINAAILNAFQGGFPAGTSGGAFWDFLAANANDANLGAISAIPSVGFVPYYQKIQQVGISAVYARGDLQFRFEGAYRKPNGEDGSIAAVIGGDYTWSNFAGTDSTLTVAMEYLYDDRDSRQPLAVFENDVFLGLNYMLNDTRDTRFRLGGFYDLDSQAQLYQLSVSTRLNDNMRAELSAVQVVTDGYNDPLAFIRDDNFLELKFSAFF